MSALLDDPSLSKLARLYGPERAEGLVRELLGELGLGGIRTPEDRLRLGAALVRRGGLLEIIGRAVRVQAILHGARED